MTDPLELFLSKHPDVAQPTDAAAPMPVGSPAKPSQPDDEMERFLAGGEDVNRLKLSLQESANVAPDVAQRILRLQTQTGLPKDFLERNLEAVERETAQQGFDAETYRKTSPAAAAWLAEHPNHPAAAREDLTKLNYLERQLRYIGANKEIGELQDELIGIGSRAMDETAGPAERTRQAAIEARLKELEALNAGTDITGFLEQMPGVAVQQWPINKRVIGGMAEGATKGLVVGAAGGAAMGGAPGAVAGGLTMLGPSALVGGGLEAGKAEMYSALLEYEKLKDANGQPLDRTTIKGLALMAGAANGSLEMLFGLEPLMLKVPGIRSLTREGLTELLKTPTSRDAALRFGRMIGQTMAEEGVTEALQMYVTKLGGAIAQTMQDGGSIVDRVFTAETAAQAVQEARAGAQGGGGMALPMASATAAVDLKRAKEAQRMREAFANIGAVAAETKLRESLPGTLRQIIEAATKEGPVETLYLPVDTFSTYFQSKGADPRDVAAALTGSPEFYDQAVASGSDLAVKTADYVELLAGTEHNAFFSQEVRPSPAAMNAREADAWMAEQLNPDVLPGVQTTAVDDPVARVRQEIAGQLEALGFDPSVVDQYAKLYQSRYQARADRRGLGEDAFELFRRAGLTIQRILPEILRTVGGNTTELDALLDRLRSGDVPKPGDIYGRSLMEALRESGLQDQGGEVSAIDPDQGRRPFERKLVREDGLTLDRAAERMHEAGYLQERSIEQLLEALRQEAAGTPIYIPGAENLLLLDVSQKLDELRHYLTEQGVDLTATPNEQIKTMFDRLLSTEETQAVGQTDPETADGETFQQSAALRRHGIPASIEPLISSTQNTESVRSHPDYAAAKAGNFAAALRLVRALVSPETVALAAERFSGAIFVAPTAEEATGHNAIPAALAALYAHAAGGTLQTTILQANQPSHTGADPMQRLIARPAFTGPVTAGSRYVLVDDNVTLGGTLAELANYLQAQGAEVAGVVVLTNATRGGTLQATPEQITRVQERFGDDIRTLFGIDPAALTGPEAGYLGNFRDAASLRARAARAHGDRVRRLRAKGLPGAEDAVDSPDTFFQSGAASAPIFFSKVEQVLREKMPTTTSSVQVRGILSSANGIKPDELKWLDIESFLKGKESVTREALLDYVRTNNVQVQDVLRGGDKTVLDRLMRSQQTLSVMIDSAKAKAFGEHWSTLTQLQRANAPNWAFDVARKSELAGESLRKINALPLTEEQKTALLDYGVLAVQSSDLNEQVLAERERTRVKFANYQLPGGEDYRELLLTLPTKRLIYTDENVVPIAPGSDPAATQPGLFWYFHTPDNLLQIPKSKHATESAALAYILKDKQPAPSVTENFTSSHFAEKNILAHVRFNTRTDADGRRVLFLEEVQSDWHQHGRKEGYATSEGQNFQEWLDRIAYTQDQRGKWTYALPDGSSWGGFDSPEEAYAAAAAALNRRSRPGVPDAPFKKTWHELALKRMLRYAAEQGYDAMAWTTGAQQAERYDLSRQVSKLVYDHGILNAVGLNGEKLMAEDVPEDQLADYIGKDAAEKLIAKAPDEDGLKIIEGLDLKVGGEGMAGFYDKMVPTFLNKYGKKWGAQVETISVTGGSSRPIEEHGGRFYLTRDDGTEENGYATLAEAETARAGGLQVQGLPITEAMKESVLQTGQPLFQAGGGKDAKGQITFGAGRIDIALLEKADLSTFIHETGHLYLNELVEDALTSGVPQQLRDDLDSILSWMGLSVRVADGAEAIKAAIGREQHEQFARGFEAYALEGQSPSLAMREVFAKFRQWLIQVYQLITYRAGAADSGRIGAALQVNLTPEVRKVMNRMVATEEEIQAMEAEASVEPMFTDAAAAGMTEAEFARYREHVTQAGLQAREALQAQVLAQLARERTAWWKEKYAEMQAQVLAEANQRPVYVALSVLQDGVMPDGAPLPEGMVAGKLSRRAVAAVLGKDFVRKLPRGTTTTDGGMTPDHAAWIFGYQSAEEFLTDLANVRNKKELVDAEAHLRMTREYGDPLIDGTLHEKARTAVLNAEREQVIEAEMVAIDKKRREVTQGALAGLMPPPESVRKLAKAQIARQRVREIRPQDHFLAAQRANKAATEALWKRDYLAAGLAKQKEFLNLALYREATAAREEVEGIVSHLRELRTKSRQEKIGKAGSDYLEQINAIMERYEFSPVPHITLAKRQALREWIAEKEHEGETLGEEFVVPEEILFEARKMNYKELPFEELEGIRDTIQQIEHFARAKNQLLAEQAIHDKEEARTLLINQLLEHTPGRPPQALTESSMTRGEKMGRLAERFHASLLKTEQLVEELDGGPEGPWHDYFWNPAAAAQAAEADYTERITGKIAEAVVNIPASIRSRMLELVTVPGLPRPMSRKEIIGAALNVGNPSNKAKLLKGMNWSDRNLSEMLDHLTKDEWDFVQRVWDTLESMWPDIVVLQKKLTGIAPEKVKVEPVQTKFGTYAGGYYPVMYAAALSAQGALQLSSTFGKLLDDNYVKATLPSGYRKGRIDEFAAPFDLDVDRLPSHIAGVVKDLTHRAWLIDANWIVSDKRIRAALKERLGEALTLRLADWVGQVANDRAGGSSKTLAVWMQMIESFRMNTVIVAMGFKFSTMASQLAGVAPAIETIGGTTGGGAKWFGVGVSEALRRPQSTYDFMVAKSGEMRHRITSRDRDLRDKLRALQGRKDLLAQLQEVSLMGIGYMELMISMPTWVGAYRKALDEGKSDEQAVRAGDRAVRLSQGAAGAKDLAAVAGRSDTMMRLLTMFYTPFSALYNRLRAIGHDVEGMEDLPRAAVRLWLTVTVAATLGELLAGHGPDKDEPWWRWWMRVQAVYPFLAVPLLRDAISTIVSGYGYQFSPIAQALESGTRLTRAAYKAAAGEKEWEELAAQSVKVFSYFVGLPTSQLLVTGKYLQELHNGSEHPDDLFEFTRKFLYSRPKE